MEPQSRGGKRHPLMEAIALYSILLHNQLCTKMLLFIFSVTPERDPLLLLLGGTTAHLSETLPLIDWNKLTPVFPTFTHFFKGRERKRRIISPYTPSFIPAFDSERWSKGSEVCFS